MMKRIGIISDTHGNRELIDEILKATESYRVSLWLHAGDYSDDAAYMRTKTHVEVIGVRGNCDGYEARVSELIPFEDTYLYITHGHQSELLGEGELMGAKLSVSGHTHVHGFYRHGHCLYVNPGSPSRPRDHSGGTWAVATYEDGQFSVEFLYVKNLIK